MGKVKKTADSAKNSKYSKNNSFSGVESHKSPKSRRKSLATIKHTPAKDNSRVKLKEQAFKSGWSVRVVKNKAEETPVVEDLPKKQRKSIVKPQTPLVLSDSTKKRRKSIVLTEASTPVVKESPQKRRKSILCLAPAEEVPVGKKSPQKRRKSIVSTEVATPLKEKKSSDSFTPKKVKGKTPVKTSGKTALEEKFKISSKNVEKAINGVIKFASENPKLQNQLFEDETPLFLQVNCFKVPKSFPKILRIPLKNTLLTPDDDVCLIVPDVKGLKNKEHEKHLEHYEELLRNKGVENIKKIMTFHEFRTEYETFELKKRLVDLYDVFLVEGKISGKVVNKCGQTFYQKRKVPSPVKLNVTKLKEHFDKALSKTQFHLHCKGDSYVVQFGHSKMPLKDLVENVFCVVEFLNGQFPGGFDNFRGLNIYGTRASSIPIYLSLKSPNEVEVPKVKPKKPKAFKTYKDELTTLGDVQVIVKPSGKVIAEKMENVAGAPEGLDSSKLINIVNRGGELSWKKRVAKRPVKRSPKKVKVDGKVVKVRRGGKQNKKKVDDK